MNAFLTIDKLSKSLAGVLAMIATVVVLGAPLTLAEYYANSASADHVAAVTVAGPAAPAQLRKS